MGVFAGIRFLCRAGPMCPAAGYAFFGGARGPRPTGRYVEPRVGDGVPQWSAAEQMPLGYDVPSARRCRAGRRIPTPVTAGHAGPALQGAAVIQGGQSRPPLQVFIGDSRAGRRTVGKNVYTCGVDAGELLLYNKLIYYGEAYLYVDRKGLEGLRTAGLRRRRKAGAVGSAGTGAPRPAGYMGDGQDRPGVAQRQRAVFPQLHRRRSLGQGQAAGELAGTLQRPDVSGEAHELQAHGAVPGAGGELGFRYGQDTERRAAGAGAESVCLHRRRDGGLRQGGRVRVPCGRSQGHGGLG